MFLSVAVALGEASWTLGYTCSEKNAQVHLFFCRLSGFVHDTQNHVYKRRKMEDIWAAAIRTQYPRFCPSISIPRGKKDADLTHGHIADHTSPFAISREKHLQLKRKASSVLLYVPCGLLDLSRLQKSSVAYAPARLPFVPRQCPESVMS